MSILDDKKSIVTDIGVLSSIGKTVQIPDPNFTFPSVNIKNEPIPFMLDLLTATIGSEALQRVTGNIFTNFIRTIEPELKASLKKQTNFFNSDLTLPTGFVSGYEVPVKQIDLFNKLRTDPSSAAGSLLYADNPNGYDLAAYNALVNPGTDVNFGNILLNYNQLTDKMVITPDTPSATMGNFVNDYIDNLTIIDEKEFTATVLDAIYGTLAKTTKKPLNSIVEEEKFKKLIQQLIDGAETATITNEELLAIQDAAKYKFNGLVPIDVGCSIIDSVLSLDEIAALISGTTGNTDPVFIGNAFNNLMENSFGKNPTQVNPTNKNAVRDGFFKKLIKTITAAIVFAITSTPQIRTLILMVNGFKNNDNVNFPANPIDDINAQKNFIKCLAEAAGSMINEFIFNLLKTELTKLILPVITILVKEKLQAFLRIIQSLF